MPDDTGPSTGVTIPQTGPGLPVLRYLLQALCLAAAAVSGGLLLRMRGREKRERR